jgi:hypothetical protein
MVSSSHRSENVSSDSDKESMIKSNVQKERGDSCLIRQQTHPRLAIDEDDFENVRPGWSDPLPLVQSRSMDAVPKPSGGVMMANNKKEASKPRCKSGCENCKSVSSTLYQIYLFGLADILHRTRKIKCGEERPSCARCVKSGWKCGGYSEVL